MATHIISFPGADIHTAKIKSTSGDIDSDGDLSLLTAGTTRATVKSNGNFGIGTITPSFKLDVVGDINFSGELYQGGSEFINTPWTIDGDDLEYTSGNIGIGTNAAAATLHVTGNTYVSSNLQVGEVANLYVDTETSNVGIGKTNPGFSLDVLGDINFSGKFYEDGVEFASSPWTVNGNDLVYTTGNIGIGTNAPSTDLHVHGGTIINSDRVAKKTYSYYGQLSSAQSIADSTIKITFSNHIFYAKVVAHLVDGSGEDISTLSFECGGGKWDGTAPSNNIALGPVGVFGISTTNPWDSSITTTATTVAFAPTTNMAAAGHYNVFIEYISQSSSGVVSKITEGTNDEITFTY